MYCTSCGSKIPDDSNFCSFCSAEQTVLRANAQKTDEADASSFGCALLGFLLPLVGIILWAIWKDETPKRAKSCLKGAIVTLVLGFISMVLGIAAFVLLSATLINA